MPLHPPVRAVLPQTLSVPPPGAPSQRWHAAHAAFAGLRSPVRAGRASGHASGHVSMHVQAMSQGVKTWQDFSHASACSDQIILVQGAARTARPSQPPASGSAPSAAVFVAQQQAGVHGCLRGWLPEGMQEKGWLIQFVHGCAHLQPLHLIGTNLARPQTIKNHPIWCSGWSDVELGCQKVEGSCRGLLGMCPPTGRFEMLVLQKATGFTGYQMPKFKSCQSGGTYVGSMQKTGNVRPQITPYGIFQLFGWKTVEQTNGVCVRGWPTRC
eukprot:1145263-Pelagomonas_calceolata.AAC.3